MNYTAVNPYTGQTITSFPQTTNAQLQTTIKLADEFYHDASHQNIQERMKLLVRLADEFEHDLHYYAQFLTTNMGKLKSEAIDEVKKTAAMARFYGENGDKLLINKAYPSVTAPNSYVEYRPTGIVVAVEPWNFPYTQVMRMFAPNFILGNSVILKHASIVPECAQAFQSACQKANLPIGAFTNLFTDYDQINTLIADSRVQGVALTGSEKAGRIIAAAAGKFLKQSTMELGGTDVFIVLKDADIKQTATDAAIARLTNAGQVCTSAKRYLVTDEVYDDFMNQLTKIFATYQPDDPTLDTSKLAPLSSKKAQETLQKQVNNVITGGSKIIWGNAKPIPGPGALFNPLIISGMTFDNPMYDTELFGPVAQVYRVNNDADIINLANTSNHGLGGAIYTKDVEHAKILAHYIETGQIAVNQVLSSQSEIPFGGVKDSGYGRELSDLGVFAFANIKAIIN